MAAEYTVRLDDEVSPGARSAKRGLDSLKGGINGVRSRCGAVGGALRGVTSVLLKVGAAAASAAVAGVAVLGAALAKSVVKAAAFQEGMEFSLTRFLGDSAKAKAELKAVRDISNRLGMDYLKAASNFKAFVSAGFTTETAKELLRMKADMLALADSVESVANVESAFTEIAKSMAAGRMEADGFNRVLENLPITKMQVMEKLAPKLGKSVKELMQTDITKLPIEQLIQAMKEATLAATGAGKAGEIAANKINSTWTGATNALKARFGNMAYDIADKVGPDIKGLMDEVMSSFSDVDTGAVIDSLASGFKAAITVVKGLFSGLKEGVGGTAQIMGPLFQVLGQLAGNTDTVTGLTAAFKAFGKGVGAVAVVAAAGIAAIGAGVAWVVAQIGNLDAGTGRITGIIDSIRSTIDGLTDGFGTTAIDIGSSIIRGIIAGVTGDVPGLISAVTGAVKAAIAAARSALDSHSPSKVFAGIGKDITAGMSQGIDAGTPAVAATTRNMVSASTGAAAASAGQTTTNNNRVTSSPTFHVSGAASPQSTAEAILRIQLDEARALLEQLGASMGASTA